MSRTDCIRLGLIGLLLASVVAALPAGGQETDSALAPINGLREDDELPPLSPSAALDTVAERYLQEMIDGRCLCPAKDGDTSAERLLDDVRSALGSETTVLDAGLVVGYDQSEAGALATTARDPANGSAIVAAQLEMAGYATAVIDAGESWLVPPPGGEGPEIDLTGYIVVVIVTAGGGE